MKLLRGVYLLLICGSLSGCWLTNAYLWKSYQSPSLSSFQNPMTNIECPKIGIQNLSSDQANSITEVVKEVCEIQATQNFRDEILKKSDWLASCDLLPEGFDGIEAREVIEIVSGPKENFSVIARKPILAIAQIDPPNARIAIRKQRFKHWRTGTDPQRAEMIATLAHEMTHFVKSDGNLSYRFRDRGHGSKRCPDNRLVSYEVGNITKRLWLAALQ